MVGKARRSKLQQATEINMTRVFQCSVRDCQFRAHRRQGLEKHIETEHANSDSWHSCDICDYRGFSTEDLELHQKTLHDGRIYSCPICETRFNKKSRLFTHYRRNHDEDTIYILYDIWQFYQIIRCCFLIKYNENRWKERVILLYKDRQVFVCDWYFCYLTVSVAVFE